MIYLVDSCNAKEVAKVMEYYPIDGVTTNPTIVAREEGDLGDLLADLREVIGPDMMLHVQTMQTKWNAMVQEALTIRDYVGGEFYVKIPATAEGLRACTELKRLDVGVTVTAVFSAQQALLAAKCGADFIAPYINKMEDTAIDAPAELARMAQLIEKNGYQAKLLAASFRNPQQVTRAMEAGAQAVTLPPAFYEKLIWHPLTDVALTKFQEDWYKVYEDDKPQDLLPV